MTSQPVPTAYFAVHTDLGDGRHETSRFRTEYDRLISLRERTQAYFTDRPVPRALGVTDEGVYLAQLLSFFLMNNDGRVHLEDTLTNDVNM